MACEGAEAAGFALFPYGGILFSALPMCCCTLSIFGSCQRAWNNLGWFCSWFLTKCIFFLSSDIIVLLQAQVTRFRNGRRKVIVLNKYAESWGYWSELDLQRVQVVFLLFWLASQVWLLCHVVTDFSSIIVLSVWRLVSRSHLLSRALTREH